MIPLYIYIYIGLSLTLGVWKESFSEEWNVLPVATSNSTVLFFVCCVMIAASLWQFRIWRFSLQLIFDNNMNESGVDLKLCVRVSRENRRISPYCLQNTSCSQFSVSWQSFHTQFLNSLLYGVVKWQHISSFSCYTENTC